MCKEGKVGQSKWNYIREGSFASCGPAQCTHQDVFSSLHSLQQAPCVLPSHYFRDTLNLPPSPPSSPKSLFPPVQGLCVCAPYPLPPHRKERGPLLFIFVLYEREFFLRYQHLKWSREESRTEMGMLVCRNVLIGATNWFFSLQRSAGVLQVVSLLKVTGMLHVPHLPPSVFSYFLQVAQGLACWYLKHCLPFWNCLDVAFKRDFLTSYQKNL